jgi:hypothetical protein
MTFSYASRMLFSADISLATVTTTLIITIISKSYTSRIFLLSNSHIFSNNNSNMPPRVSSKYYMSYLLPLLIACLESVGLIASASAQLAPRLLYQRCIRCLKRPDQVNMDERHVCEKKPSYILYNYCSIGNRRCLDVYTPLTSRMRIVNGLGFLLSRH